MKKLLLLIALSLTATITFAAETKQICTDTKDKTGRTILNKDGTAKQNCRTIKIHKKYDGTVVPTKAPVKPVAKPPGFDAAVQKRQKELVAAGAKITVDGITGPGTRRAEAEFGHLVPKK